MATMKVDKHDDRFALDIISNMVEMGGMFFLTVLDPSLYEYIFCEGGSMSAQHYHKSKGLVGVLSQLFVFSHNETHKAMKEIATTIKTLDLDDHLVVQINHADCGAIAISITIAHKISKKTPIA
jgi:hypothetical protein